MAATGRWYATFERDVTRWANEGRHSRWRTGSRLHPLTRITNKHLLPIYDRPMVTYAVEAMVIGGISEIMVVTGGTHAGEFLRLLGNGHEWGVERLQYAYQEGAGGIAEALGLARKFVDGDKLVVLLADNIFERSIGASISRFTAQRDGARLVLAAVSDPERLRHLGVPTISDEGTITSISEKPETPPSLFAVTGVYFYGSDVFDVVAGLVPSARGSRSPTLTTTTSPVGA